jgi:hypothetical protein
MKILPPLQAVKNEFTPEPIIISSSNNQELHQTPMGLLKLSTKNTNHQQTKHKFARLHTFFWKTIISIFPYMSL